MTIHGTMISGLACMLIFILVNYFLFIQNLLLLRSMFHLNWEGKYFDFMGNIPIKERYWIDEENNNLLVR